MAVIKLSEAKINFIKDVCKSYGNKPGEVINVLHKVQGEYGYLPAEVQELVAKELGIPVSRVYGIVSFYSFFTMTPKGEHPISVCLGTACYVRGAEKVLDELKRQLGIGVGEVTPDGKFSLKPPLRRRLRSGPRHRSRRQGLRPYDPRPREGRAR